jgi:hypothetical protein
MLGICPHCVSVDTIVAVIDLEVEPEGYRAQASDEEHFS